MTVDRFTARLDDDAFVGITRVSPSLSRLFGDRLYLRGKAEYADNASSLESARYDEMVYTVSVGASF